MHRCVTRAGSRRSGGASLVGALLGITTAALGFVGCGSGPLEGGPLTCSGCPEVGVSITMDAGKRGTNGVTVLENSGPEPAVLDRISLRKPSPGLEVPGLFVIRVGDLPRLGLAAGAIDGFPPRVTKGILHPVKGFKVNPYRGRGDAVEVIIGFSPPHDGTFSYRGVEVYYHVGKKNYVAFHPDAFAVCAPRQLSGEGCHAPGQ